MSNPKKDYRYLQPRVLGGVGNRCNNNTQWHQQNRIYDNGIAISVTAEFIPYYIEEQDERKR